MRNASQLFFVHCLSPVHVGAGQGIGVIDMPIIRERITEWPYIPGSTSKGVHREYFRRNGEEEWLKAAFGTRNEAGQGNEEEGNAGALVFSDAKMLAFPVASFFGVFAYVTCPLALKRLQQDCTAVGLPTPDIAGLDLLAEGEAWIADISKAVVVDSYDAGSQTVTLDEFEFHAVPHEQVTRFAEWVGASLGSQQDMAERLKQRLVIISDDAFQYFTTMCCEIVPRIRIDDNLKTTVNGALWQEEYIPAEAILYGTLWSDYIYRNNSKLTPQSLLDQLQRERTLQVGGNASVGKGLVTYYTGGRA
ncbi:type III-B CRISPR module RAMP protein Cmr4 [Paenibacillus sp. NPDC058071]|uniref:type III-B CRISPR module RAMP protein Cmr4 n=1 Tax=Paenibacillus sp. NPDC058071 TaxID=3346326 RepID=UPI0036D7B31E